jgi:hypothetical protein
MKAIAKATVYSATICESPPPPERQFSRAGVPNGTFGRVWQKILNHKSTILKSQKCKPKFIQISRPTLEIINFSMFRGVTKGYTFKWVSTVLKKIQRLIHRKSMLKNHNSNFLLYFNHPANRTHYFAANNFPLPLLSGNFCYLCRPFYKPIKHLNGFES